MTWHTAAGDRYLVGAEAHLFRAAMKETLVLLKKGALDCTDTLLEVQPKKAKLHLFALVGKYLLEPTDDLPPFNAWTEGAVGIIYGSVASSLDAEIEAEGRDCGQPSHNWREKILAAALERGWKWGDEVADADASRFPEHLESSVWHEMLEFLEEQILWGLDWAADPFESPAGDFDQGEESYFRWCHKSALDAQSVIELLGRLCDYHHGESEGNY